MNPPAPRPPRSSYAFLWLIGLGLSLAISFASFNFAPFGLFLAALAAYSLVRVAVETVRGYRRGRPRLREWLATIWIMLRFLVL